VYLKLHFINKRFSKFCFVVVGHTQITCVVITIELSAIKFQIFVTNIRLTFEEAIVTFSADKIEIRYIAIKTNRK
jgi:hypothetical protein